MLAKKRISLSQRRVLSNDVKKETGGTKGTINCREKGLISD